MLRPNPYLDSYIPPPQRPRSFPVQFAFAWSTLLTAGDRSPYPVKSIFHLLNAFFLASGMLIVWDDLFFSPFSPARHRIHDTRRFLFF